MTRRIWAALTLLIITSASLADSRKIELAPSPQRHGDPQQGYRYLVEGDYISSGVPIELYRLAHPQPAPNVLNRSGDNATIDHRYTAVTAPNGVRVVAPNCISCHAQRLNGKFILGLGNAAGDFTHNNSPNIAAALDQTIIATYGPDSPAREAYRRFKEVTTVVGPQIPVKVRGTNPADKLAYVLAAHRDPQTLAWSDSPLLPLPPADEIIPTDVPPWWVLKKKHAMFYTGIGRGDFARIMMASSLLTMSGVEEAACIDQRFVDVLAYLNTIEPPAYDGVIDRDLAAEGRAIFDNRCASCHGDYGPGGKYPNLLVPLEEVKTDALLAEATHTTYAAAREAYNRSWFGQGPHAARLVSQRGYVAPPLDGIWASAPYLHNASVPTLETLLDSSRRPRYWQRSFNTSDYDHDAVGWRYQLRESGGDKRIYDTTLPGHSNAGHTYGDKLTPAQRRALLEYLKTL